MRRVIELALPSLVREVKPRVEEILLVGGELPDMNWLNQLERNLAGVAVSCKMEPALGYFSEQHRPPSEITNHVRAFLSQLLPEAEVKQDVVWAHNPGLGRNLILTRELVRHCASRRFRLILHHHDWWFDNRWQRWPEIRRAGFHSLRQVAQTVFPVAREVRLIAINRADTGVLERRFPKQVAWLPNPAPETPLPNSKAVRRARLWLQQQTEAKAPVWLMPCRLVRRKNIAEALLLTRWLRPEAWLVTTGGVSSKDEEAYARRLENAVEKHGWRLRLAVLQGDESAKPTVPELMAASETILLTSLQEGFGLPYIEAVSAGKPLIARSLPNMAPDLGKFGFRFPQMYQEVLVAPCLFDWAAEQERQRALFALWYGRLPRACQKYVKKPQFLRLARSPKPVAFSRLTLTAQLEVLAWPAPDSFELCAPLNPILKAWRSRAETAKLDISPWPKSALKWLSGSAYGRSFSRMLNTSPPQRQRDRASLSTQAEFLRVKLAPENLYPLLWSTQS